MRKGYIIILFLAFKITFAQRYTTKQNPIIFGKSNDFSPAQYESGIIYCSDRSNSSKGNYKGSFITDLFYSSLDSLKDASAKSLLKNLNSEYHDGPIAFYNNYNSAVFASNIIRKGSKKDINDPKNQLGLFFAEKINEEWKIVDSFRHNSTMFTISHPAITEDGNTLFFAADPPSGLGGFDIFVTTKFNGDWSVPRNLGGPYNTEYNEAFPTVYNNFLFISSDRIKKMHYDIYYCHFDSISFSPLIRMDSTINTKYDEFSFLMTKEDSIGYFSSNRNGNDDIFKVVKELPVFSECDSLVKDDYCFTFYELGSMEISDMPLKYQWDLGDSTTINGLEARHCYSRPGTYQVQLNLFDTLINEVFMNEASYDMEVLEPHQIGISYKEPLVSNKEISFTGKSVNLPFFKPNQYFWYINDTLKGIGKIFKYVFNRTGNYHLSVGCEGLENNQYKTYCTYKNLYINNDSLGIYNLSNSDSLIVYEKSENAITNETLNYSDRKSNNIFKLEIETSLYPLGSNHPFFNKARNANYNVEEIVMMNGNDTAFYSYAVNESEKAWYLYNDYKDLKQLGYENTIVKSFTKDTLYKRISKTYKKTDTTFSIESELNNDRVSYITYKLNGKTVKIRFDKSSIRIPINKKLVESVSNSILAEYHDSTSGPLPDTMIYDIENIITEKQLAIINTKLNIKSKNLDEKTSKSNFEKSYRKILTTKLFKATELMHPEGDSLQFSIFFDVNSSSLDQSDINVLTKVVKAFKENDSGKIFVIGHTDATSSSNYNTILSKRRAKSAANWLISKGISKSKIITKGVGADDSVAPNDTEFGKQLNRRVVIQLK
ncbi:MAG: OmpA family protein [Bacteroidia bacterium]